MILFHTYTIQLKRCFSIFIYRSLGEVIHRTNPSPPFHLLKKNVVDFMKQNKMYIVKTNTLYNNERYVYYLPIKIIFFLVLVGYSNNYVFDFSNVVLQSLINLRSFKMYMYFIYQLYGYRRIS